MIVDFLVSTLGFLQIRKELSGNSKFFGLTSTQQSVLSQINMCFFVLFITSVFIFKIPSIFLLIVIGIFIFSLKFLSFLAQKWIESLLPALYLELLEEMILSMQVGSSVKNALQTALTRRIGWERHLWSSALEVMEGKTDLFRIQSKKKQKIFKELCDLSQEKYKILDFAKLLRHQLRIELNLRRKSRQASQQAVMQATMLSVFYLLGVVFLTLRFGFFSYPRILIGSFFLFSSGLMGMWWLMRRQKWEI